MIVHKSKIHDELEFNSDTYRNKLVFARSSQKNKENLKHILFPYSKQPIQNQQMKNKES